MPLKFAFEDITKIRDIHVLVNSANPEPGIIGNGVERAIYEAAGKESLSAERALRGTIKPGHVAVTQSYRLFNETGAKYIIHTVATPWCGGDAGEQEVLTTCYANALRQAKTDKCTQIAFPLLGTGTYGFPPETAFKIAVTTIKKFLKENRKCTVYLSIVDKKAIKIAEDYLKSDCEAYLDQKYLESTVSEYIKNHFDVEEYEHETDQVERFRKTYDDLCEQKKQSCMDFITAHRNKMDFAGTLQYLMTKYDKDRKYLISEAYCTETYISTWLSGKKVPGVEYIYAISLALHLSKDDFAELLASAGFSARYDDLYWAVLWHIEQKRFDVLEFNNFIEANGYGSVIFDHNRSNSATEKDESDLIFQSTNCR